MDSRTVLRRRYSAGGHNNSLRHERYSRFGQTNWPWRFRCARRCLRARSSAGCLCCTIHCFNGACRACDALSQQLAARFRTWKCIPSRRSRHPSLGGAGGNRLCCRHCAPSHRPRSRLGVAMRPLANGPYLIGTQLLRKPHGSASSCRTVYQRAVKVAATEAA